MNYPNEQGWKLVGLACMLISALIMVFCIIGIYDCFWNVPAKKAEIFSLTQQNELLQAAIIEKDKYIQHQKTAFRFENLFMLAADENDKMDFTMLEDMLCEKRGLCK